MRPKTFFPKPLVKAQRRKEKNKKPNISGTARKQPLHLPFLKRSFEKVPLKSSG
jgi:hypothetical protein